MPAKPTLETRVARLETQMEEVLAKPALRKRTERGVCTLGNDPSSACPDASLGKFQSGCHGDACLLKQSEYFKEYRARKKAEANAVAVAAPVKKTAAKKAAAPAKKAVKRRSAPPAPAPVKGVKRRKSA